MKYIYLVIALYCSEWILYPDAEWEFLLGTKYLIISLLVTGLFIELKTSLINRSVLALLVLSAWCDLITYVLWQTGISHTDLSPLCALIFFYWLNLTIHRSYPDHIDSISIYMTCILIKKPTDSFDVFKSLVGFPAASVCILAGGFVWSFRKHTGKFEKTLISHFYLEKHLVVNTLIKTTPEIIAELEKVLGEKRFPYCKCIWSIRKVLSLLGGKYKPKLWDYLPSIFALKIIRK